MKRNKRVEWRPIDVDRLDLTGKKVAIVGGTGGIGRAFSCLFAARGAYVTVVGRTFRDSHVPGIDFVEADLGLMTEAERVAKMLLAETLDHLIFTTGIFAGPKRQETPEGIERDMAVSYLNRLVMVREMAPRLGRDRLNPTMKPRVFVVAYPGTGQVGTPDDLNAEKSYKALPQHMNTVAGNEILVLDAAERYPHVNFYGFNPGLIATDIRSNFMGHNKLLFNLMEGAIALFSQDTETYAKRVVPLMLSPDLEGHSGSMFDRKGRAILPSEGLTESHRKKFISASEALVARAGVHL
jgi:NAD(P)-dependent dehydrogenase (short-subunit alcohol dehydrogenase family)